MAKIALYDILVPSESGLPVEEIPAGKAIPAKYRKYMEEWEARGLLADGNDADQKNLEAAESQLEDAEKKLLEATQKEAEARAKMQEKAEEANEPRNLETEPQRTRKPATAK